MNKTDRAPGAMGRRDLEGGSRMKKGFQLYSVRDQYGDGESMKRVLRALGDMGYDGVEFYDYAGLSPEEMKAALKEAGLTAFNTHVGYERLQNRFDEEVAYAAKLGLEGIIIPFIPEDKRSKEDFQSLMKQIPRWAEKCRRAGLTLTYHNHAFEFVPWEKDYLLDAVLGSERELRLELDTFWAYYAGVDVLDLMETHRGRIQYVQLKDYARLKEGEFPEFCAVGAGNMIFEPYIEKARELGVRWIVVEQDNSRKDSLECARESIEALRRFRV